MRKIRAAKVHCDSRTLALNIIWWLTVCRHFNRKRKRRPRRRSNIWAAFFDWFFACFLYTLKTLEPELPVYCCHVYAIQSILCLPSHNGLLYFASHYQVKTIIRRCKNLSQEPVYFQLRSCVAISEAMQSSGNFSNESYTHTVHAAKNDLKHKSLGIRSK